MRRTTQERIVADAVQLGVGGGFGFCIVVLLHGCGDWASGLWAVSLWVYGYWGFLWCWVCWLLFEHNLLLLYVRTVVFGGRDFKGIFGFWGWKIY